MDTNALKRFAQEARRQLLAQVEARMAHVLEIDSVALREKQSVITELRALISAKGKENVIEEVAYTWFNRLCALRYMDVNHYTRMGVVSPVEGFTQPEILQNAKQGVFNPEWQVDRNRVEGLLSGRITSGNAEQEAYRLLLVSVCNAYAREMDFLFEAIEDYTELLMPEDLLSSQSVLHAVQQTLTAENCQDVEVVGWLYQFYISEKKDQVMATKGAVKKEDIPAVTQLFTPDWIVRYMVQNSLGRLWLLNHPDSAIRLQMEYYIQPAEPETDYLKVASPEELKILDPACGSGHILTYAFDLLYAIYEEQGYDPLEIPRFILSKNLYGIEIDKRAAMLSSFALIMKAMSRDKRFFKRGISPNILEMEDVTFSSQEIKDYLAKIGKDLWTQDLWEGLQQFENAKTFGSLIRPVIKDVPYLRKRMQEAGVFEDLFLSRTSEKVGKVLQMAEYLSPRYQVVVANPPYLSISNANEELKRFATDHYPDGKTDLFAIFILRNLTLVFKNGIVGMITMQSWMFLASYEKLRSFLLKNISIFSLAHIGSRGFDSIGGEVVSTAAFVMINHFDRVRLGSYYRLVDGDNEEQKSRFLREAIVNPYSKMGFRISHLEYFKVPGYPIVYWMLPQFFKIYEKTTLLGDATNPRQGLTTTDNSKFVRLWFEVNKKNIGFGLKSSADALNSSCRWFPYNKGGSFRRWSGNQVEIVDWENDGSRIKQSVIEKYPYLNNNPDFVTKNQSYYFRSGITWSKVSTNLFGSRLQEEGVIFSDAGECIFPDSLLEGYCGYLNSKMVSFLLSYIAPTINFKSSDIAKLPSPSLESIEKSQIIARELVGIFKKDWDSFETSWSFESNSLLKSEAEKHKKIEIIYTEIFVECMSIIELSQQLEEKNNLIFIDAYGLQDKLTPEVPLEAITLTCNPHYRYGPGKKKDEYERLQRADTMKEFISYTVGCMFGRYSLDKPGLILANQGETLKDYLRIIGKKPTFTPTETNVIPILEGDWFADDIVARFKQFLKVTFGEPNYDENLRFIEGALGRDLRGYFLKDFYKDHVQMYKKRPIYWLFSSPKGSFNALIYMHRYHQDTVNILLNQYLREFREKLSAHRKRLDAIIAGAGTSSREKTQALRERESVSLVLQELKDYEDNILFPLATQRINIDLDDGVKANYPKFGDALAKIKGLSDE